MERIPGLRKFAVWIRQKADKNKGQIEKFGFWGLVLFVGIPLPGTGAWTGSLVAALLHMKFGKAIGAILIEMIQLLETPVEKCSGPLHFSTGVS